MKYLFYVLLLVNAVFFIWKSGLNPVAFFSEGDNVEQVLALPEEPASPLTSVVSNEPEAPLVETEGGTEASAEDSVPSESASSFSEDRPPLTQSINGCYEIGPVASKETADAYLALLTSTSKEARVVLKSGSVPDGWWVLYPRAPNVDAARVNRRMLEKKGILDAWVFDKGPLRGAISLGLYPSRSAAELAAKPFSEKGIVVEVAPRRVRGDAFWIEVPWQGLALDLEEIIQVLNTQDPQLQMPLPLVCRQ